MGGRGASSGGRGGGGGGLNPSDIVSTTDLVVQRGKKQVEVDETLEVFRDIQEEYGYTINAIELATLKGRGANVLGYYDGSNIALNQSYFDKAKMESSYKACVEAGFHPSNGNKSGLQAVVSHELGHALTDSVADKMGIKGINKTHEAATRIVNEARKQTGHRGVVQMASKISGYAKYSNAEAIAEAFSDVYCNGKSAKRESQAIVNVMNGYLK